MTRVSLTAEGLEGALGIARLAGNTEFLSTGPPEGSAGSLPVNSEVSNASPEASNAPSEVSAASSQVSVASSKVNNASHEIWDASPEVKHASHEIWDASHEVKDASDEISDASLGVKNASHEVWDASHEVKNASHEVSHVALEVSQSRPDDGLAGVGLRRAAGTKRGGDTATKLPKQAIFLSLADSLRLGISGLPNQSSKRACLRGG
jgi:hypothetical protein